MSARVLFGVHVGKLIYICSGASADPLLSSVYVFLSQTQLPLAEKNIMLLALLRTFTILTGPRCMPRQRSLDAGRMGKCTCDAGCFGSGGGAVLGPRI